MMPCRHVLGGPAAVPVTVLCLCTSSRRGYPSPHCLLTTPPTSPTSPSHTVATDIQLQPLRLPHRRPPPTTADNRRPHHQLSVSTDLAHVEPQLEHVEPRRALAGWQPGQAHQPVVWSQPRGRDLPFHAQLLDLRDRDLNPKNGRHIVNSAQNRKLTLRRVQEKRMRSLWT